MSKKSFENLQVIMSDDKMSSVWNSLKFSVKSQQVIAQQDCQIEKMRRVMIAAGLDPDAPDTCLDEQLEMSTDQIGANNSKNSCRHALQRVKLLITVRILSLVLALVLTLMSLTKNQWTRMWMIKC